MPGARVRALGGVALLGVAFLVAAAAPGRAVEDTRSELSVTLTGNGTAEFWTTDSGGSPDGRIDCRRESEMTTGTCSTKYQVTVSQTVYWLLFVGKGSARCPSHPPCDLPGTSGSTVMYYNQDSTLGWTVVLTNPMPLTITRSGTGSGRVTSDPIGIDCGSDCFNEYPFGHTIGLAQVADAGSVFVGWSDDIVTSQAGVEFEIQYPTTIDARFDLLVAPTATPPPATTGPTATPRPSVTAAAPPSVLRTADPDGASGAPSISPSQAPTSSSPEEGSSEPPPSEVGSTPGPVAAGGTDVTAAPDPASIGGAGAVADGSSDGNEGFVAGLAAGIAVMLVVVAIAIGTWVWRARARAKGSA